ncbi:MAG TPA: DNA repair protein RecN [Clostridiales bacterium]|nr:DNA repair protein RecN [Clostridiales bacterium]
MLNELHIENLAVIERADIRFAPGLNVLTGETGAGKSIVIDSIGAVLGDRVSREMVRRGAEHAVVTATFDISEETERFLRENEIDIEDELILQRRIGSDGKSSCRICGVPVSAAQLKELASKLVDIHGQNDGRQLTDERRHLEYLDRFGVLAPLLSEYSVLYARFYDIKKQIESLRLDEEEKDRLRDRLSYRISELESADLKSGEYDEISSRLSLLRNSEKLTEAIESACALLYDGEENAVSLAQNAEGYAQRAASLAPELEGSVKSIRDAVFSLTDAAEILRDMRDELDFSPEEFDRLETRLSLLNRLQRKYNADENGLIALLDESRQKLDEIDSADETIQKLERELDAARTDLLKKAQQLSEARKNAAIELQNRIVSELKELSMPSVRFAVDFSPVGNEDGFNARGCDNVRFIMSANAGEELGRISRIASGGELSRIMLAMKNVFAENDPIPTMIFDEIDSGVSGVAAQRIGEKLYSVSLGKQVMCVTHLPQIAAMADSQFVIAKTERDGRTYTDVTMLDRQGRTQEIARLYGGDHITPLTLANAEEQLTACEKYKNTKNGCA